MGNGIDRHKEYHQFQQSGQERGRQVVGIIEPGVVQRVVLHRHRLQDCFRYLRRGAFCNQVGLDQASGCGNRHGFEPLEYQRAGNIECQVGVECQRWGASGHGFAFEILWNDEEPEYLPALNGCYGLVIGIFTLGDIYKLHCVERPCKLSRHLRMVEVDHRRRHFLGKPLAE